MKSKLQLIILLLMPAFANAAVDFTVKAITPMEYQVPGTKDFSITIFMVGNSNFYSAKFYWQLDNGPIDSVTKSPFDLKWHSITTGWVTDPAFKVVLTTPGKHKLKAWIKTVTADVNPTNDTLTVDVNVFSTLPKKNVLMEVFNLQSFGMCYKTDNFNDTVVSKNPDYIVVKHYYRQTESLFSPDSRLLADEYDSTHSFSTLFDRYHFPFALTIGNNYITDGLTNIVDLFAYGQREQFYEPVDVHFTKANYNPTTRELNVTVAARFYDTLSGDYRFNVYLTENLIDSQVGAPTPSSFHHKNVLRAMLGGPWGKQGSIPASVSSGTGCDYHFTYTIPAAYNIDSFSLIGLVQKYDTNNQKRRILNSVQKPLQKVVSVNNEISTQEHINIYPNPNNGTFTVQTTCADFKTAHIAVYDMMGRLVKSQSLVSGSETISLNNAPKGLYLIKLQVDDAVLTNQVVIE